MVRLNQEEGRYRVLLIGIGDHTEEEKDSFCHQLSKSYSIPSPLLKKIVDRCPIILKKNLSFKKAEMLARTLKSFGATVSVEERRNFPPLSLEFQELVPHQLALESSYLRKAQRGTWSFEGDLSIKRISVAFKNASGQPIPAVDKRKKREWGEVEMGGWYELFFPSP